MALTWRNVGMPSNAAAAGMMNAAFRNQQQGLSNLRGLGDKFIADRNKAQDKLRTENTDNFRAQYLNANNDAERAAIANNIAGFGGDLNQLDLAQSRNKSVDRGQQQLLNETQLRKAQLSNDINAGILGNQEASFKQDADRSASNILKDKAAINVSNQRTRESNFNMAQKNRQNAKDAQLNDLFTNNLSQDTNGNPALNKVSFTKEALNKGANMKEVNAFIGNYEGIKNKDPLIKERFKAKEAKKLALFNPKNIEATAEGLMAGHDKDWFGDDAAEAKSMFIGLANEIGIKNATKVWNDNMENSNFSGNELNQKGFNASAVTARENYLRDN